MWCIFILSQPTFSSSVELRKILESQFPVLFTEKSLLRRSPLWFRFKEDNGFDLSSESAYLAKRTRIN